MTRFIRIEAVGPTLAAFALALLVPADAVAWDSICYRYEDPTARVDDLRPVMASRGCGDSGFSAARGRWRDPVRQVDEHRALFETALRRSGVPEALLETYVLSVPAANIALPTRDGSELFSIAPTWIGGADHVARRAFALDELAQLPDFSYSLGDWAMGNEGCPIESAGAPLGALGTPERCHAFSTHMGAVNSSHFPPQSDRWFQWLHSVALARAAECRAQRNLIWSAAAAGEERSLDARFTPIFRECEMEAMAIEAVAQHYLGDSWSAGHIWQRWGASTLDAFPLTRATDSGGDADAWNALVDAGSGVPRLVVAEMVALTAGVIHGSDPVLFEALGATQHDAMCFPHTEVRARTADGAPFQVAGDLHLHDVVGGLPLHSDISVVGLPYAATALATQGDRLLTCASGAIAEVYAALGDGATYGAPTFGSTIGVPTFDAASCVAPAATNTAIDEGIDALDWSIRYAETAAVPIADIPDSIESRAREDYARLRFAASVLARARPDATDMSGMTLRAAASYTDVACDDLGCRDIVFTVPAQTFTMPGVDPNRCHSTGGDAEGCASPPPAAGGAPAPYADPRPPFVRGSDLIVPANESRGALALAFHRAHARELCRHTTAADLDHLASLVTTAATAAERSAACDACGAYTAAHLRVGTSASDYDAGAEPFCHYVGGGAGAFVYEPLAGGGTALDLARRRCGCGGELVAITNAGYQRLELAESAGAPILTPAGPVVSVGSLPRDASVASDGTVLVSNGAGEVVGISGDVEVDLDGIDTNGVTRITFPGATQIQGVATVSIGGRELLLVAARTTGELIAWDLEAHVECGRVSVRRSAGEEAFDVAVSPDGTRAWVATRRLSPITGAIAVVDLVALATCDPAMLPVARHIVPPGAPVALSAIAVSPTGARLAIGMRLAATCPDTVATASGGMMEVQVGCDGVFIMDTSTEAFSTFGTRLSLPTRPGRYAYAASWFPDGRRVAYAAFQGIDVFSGWPAGSASPLPTGGTLRIGDVDSASFEGGGVGGPRHWTYNAPLDGSVIGETVAVAPDGRWVFVGTASGRVAAFPVAAHDATLDPFWEAAEADPETRFHASLNGSWYGGCRHLCGLPGGRCPDVCPTTTGLDPAGYSHVELGSSVRVLLSR